MCLIQMQKYCKNYPVLLSFTEFEVLSLFSDSFLVTPASKTLLAFVADLQPGAWKLPVTFVTHWSWESRALQVNNAESLLGTFLMGLVG